MIFRYTSHAIEEMKRRGISKEIADRVCYFPEQKIPQDNGRVVHQSQIEVEPGRIQLIRVFIDPNDNPPAVVTAYRTSKIEKYWSTS